MILGRNKCVIKGATQQKVMPHDEFINRIRKSLYFGGDTLDEDMEVSRPLADYASELFSEPHKGHSLHRLNRVTAGSVHATPCSLIMALIYLDRLNATDPGYVRRITPQELFIVSMMISTKFYAGHDEEIYLSDWAEDGNMNEDRLKQLELEFLSAINWNIYISNEQFFNKLSNIEKSLARREGLKRGWLTYGELMQMLPSFTLVKFLLNNITVMAVSYAASVMTIAGAFFLASQIPITSLHRMQHRKTTVGGVGAGDAAANLMTNTNVLPTPQDLLLTEDARHNNSATSTPDATASNTTTSLQIANASCRALNVEAELLKLERQYYEEALHEQLSRRHNEFVAGASNELLYNGFELTLLQRASNDATRNWLSLKEEYSDRHFNLLPDTQRPAATNDAFSATNTFGYTPPLSAGAATAWPTLAHCADNLGNCTSSLFWNLLADAAESSIVRLPPFLWFKFM